MKAIERSNINPKQRDINFYLEKIGIERFNALEVFSTVGDIRPPYPYQWRATSVVFGDDKLEGIGKTPFEAIKRLYFGIKEIENG